MLLSLSNKQFTETDFIIENISCFHKNIAKEVDVSILFQLTVAIKQQSSKITNSVLRKIEEGILDLTTEETEDCSLNVLERLRCVALRNRWRRNFTSLHKKPTHFLFYLRSHSLRNNILRYMYALIF